MMLAFYRSVLAMAFVLCQMRTLVEACEPFTVNTTAQRYCASFGYNMTALVDYRTQKEAAYRFLEFKPLIDIECSTNIKIFLCSYFFPMCHPLMANKGIPPCRSLCLHARSGCEPVMQKFGYSWPNTMNCTSFPQFGGGELCVAQNTSSSSESTTTTTNTTAPPTTAAATTKSVERPKGSTKRLTLKQQQKTCWKGDKKRGKSENKVMKKCCRYGKKIVNVNVKSTCSLRGRLRRKKERNLMRKVKKQCNQSTMTEGCFQSCCLYRKKQRKNNKRKNKRRS